MKFTSFTALTWDGSEVEFRRQPVGESDAQTYVALYLVKPVNRGLLFTVGNPMSSEHDSEQWREKLERIAVMVFGKKRNDQLNAQTADMQGLAEAIKKLMW